ncbi:MAG: YerC/YecD family TrpR-related protein [Woeseiaceae bacterium]|nr:YerC/YecD family TrpR-related protein [Woeseiaceae bacterium]
MKPKKNESGTQRKRAEDALFRAVKSLRTTAECRNFFKDLCTPAELQALADRWQVVELLLQGMPYRQIQEQTGVSVTTVGRVARFLTDGFGGYRTAVERVLRKQYAQKSGASH